MNNTCNDCGFSSKADAKICESCGRLLKQPLDAPNAAQMSSQPLVVSSDDPAVEKSTRLTNPSGLANESIGRGKRLANDARTKIRAAHPHKLAAVAVIAATLLVWVLLEFSRGPSPQPSGWNYLAWTTYLLTLVPLSCGAILILVSGLHTPDWLTRFSAWMDGRAANSRGAEGRFNHYIARPVLWSYETLNHHASQISDDMLRNGAWVAAYAFSVILFCLLLFWTIALAISIFFIVIFGAVMVFLADSVLGTNNGGRLTGVLRGRSPSSKGEVYSGTNAFNEQVAGRVDKDGSVYEGSSMFNEQRVGRVDADGNHYKGTNLFNEQKTGRTDKDGNIYEGTNVLNERRVGRVDGDGNILEGTNALNEHKVGRVEKN